jgi:hypothetical protein
MTGTLDETYLSALEEDSQPEDQSSLFDFSENESNHTTIAVVRKPNDTGILDATDEFMPSLGMPSHALGDFQYVREGFNSKDPVERHNKAFIKCGLDQAYRSHLRYNDDAKERMEEIEQRLRDGEDITLVCFEKPPKKCHRHILIEFLEQRMKVQTLKS